MNCKLKNDSIYYVSVLRKIGEDDGTLDGYTTVQEYILNNYTTYTDNNVPAERIVTYKIRGVIPDGYPGYSGRYVYSNAVKYERDINTINTVADNVLYQEHNNTLFFFNSSAGVITSYNLDTKEQNAIEVNSAIGYCKLSKYNNKYELLVPRSDGWLFVYDADSLTLKHQVKVSESSLSSVADNDSLLYINSSNYYENLYVVSRNNYTVLHTLNWGYTGDNNKKIQIIPGTSTELFDANDYYLTYAVFDGTGNLIQKVTSDDWSSYNYSSNFKIIPNSKKAIFAPYGKIYNNTTNYVNGIPYGSFRFSDFLFNSSGDEVYTGCSNSKKIVAYNAVSLQEIKHIQTQAYPFRLFYNNGQIICVSVTTTSSYTTSYSQFVVEYFDESIN